MIPLLTFCIIISIISTFGQNQTTQQLCLTFKDCKSCLELNEINKQKCVWCGYCQETSERPACNRNQLDYPHETFTVWGCPPTIDKIEPNYGLVGENNLVIIKGWNLDTSKTENAKNTIIRTNNITNNLIGNVSCSLKSKNRKIIECITDKVFYETSDYLSIFYKRNLFSGVKNEWRTKNNLTILNEVVISKEKYIFVIQIYNKKGLSLPIIIVITLFSIFMFIMIMMGMISEIRKINFTQLLNETLEKWERFLRNKLRRKMVGILNKREKLIDISRVKINYDEAISGHYGNVYSGVLDDEIVVAVKTVKENSNRQNIEFFFDEAMLLIDCNHERILTPIGVWVKDNAEPLIIMPFMKNGELLKYLRSGNLLSIKQLYKMAEQASEAMEYLSSKHIVHRDLAARNCLLDENMDLKIGDFGLSRDIYSKHYYRGKHNLALPYKWMSIEAIEKKYFTTESDVWSFGVLFWEIISGGEEPYPKINNESIEYHIKSGHRLPKPEYCDEFSYKLMQQCWDSNPKSRPKFSEITKFIAELNKNSSNDFVESGNVNYRGNPLNDYVMSAPINKMNAE